MLPRPASLTHGVGRAGRQVDRLTLDSFAELPADQQACLYWVSTPVERARVHGHEAEEKRAWLSMVLREWGACGCVVRVEGRYAAHAIWAPPVHLPGSASLPTAPVSQDAVLLAEVYVAPSHRGEGLGRLLVQTAAKELVLRGDVRSVEAFGAGRSVRAAQHPYVVPADFWAAVGFATQRDHRSFPRMRMDLHSTVRWRAEVEAALARLLAPVTARPPSPAAPARVRRHGPPEVPAAPLWGRP